MSDEIKKRIALEGLIVIYDRCGVFHGRIEDLMFRAQRIASALKMNAGGKDPDFESDLKLFRNDLKKFRFEVEEALSAVRALSEEGYKSFNSRLIGLHGRFNGLADYVALAHQRMPMPDSRLEAWYCLREVSEMIDCLMLKKFLPQDPGPNDTP